MKKMVMFILATIVCTLLSRTVLANETSLFSDVKPTHWAAKTIQWGLEKKIVSGNKDGAFRPDDPVTESEFLTMLFKAFGGVPNFTKEQLNDWNLRYLKETWAKPLYVYTEQLDYDNIMTQDMYGTPLPNTRVSRLWVAELITATQGVHLTGDFAIKYALGNGFVSLRGESPSIDKFNGQATVTRAEAVQFIKNLADRGITKLQKRAVDTTDIKILDDLPTKILGKTMFDKIKDIVTNDRYIVQVTASMDLIAIKDTTTAIKSRGNTYYSSIIQYNDMRLSKGRVGIVSGYWELDDQSEVYYGPSKDTYNYMQKILGLMSVPKADEIIQRVKSTYNKGVFNQYGQISYNQIVGEFKLSILISENGSKGIVIMIDKR